MVKTSLSNHASNILYRKPVNACWHDKVTCTTESTVKQIQSDVVAASYEFLMTYDSTNLLQALKIAKSTSLKFEHGIISCDEFTEVSYTKALLRLFIKFSDDKKKIKVKCFIQRESKPVCSITTSSASVPEKLRELHKAIIKLEDDYDNL